MDNGPFSFFDICIYLLEMVIDNSHLKLQKGIYTIYIYSSDTKKKIVKGISLPFLKEHLNKYKIHAISLTFQYR